jgi:hypothetical protein
LQQSLDRFADWTIEWQTTININKSAVLSLSRKSQPTLHVYLIDGLAISPQNSCVDLGVTLSSKIRTAYNEIVSKAQPRISVLLRDFQFRYLGTVWLEFITYICPLLKYNSIIWNPAYVYLIDLIENVQQKFIKALPSISSLS